MPTDDGYVILDHYVNKVNQMDYWPDFKKVNEYGSKSNLE